MSKTQIWQELVNSDNKLASEKESLINRRSSGKKAIGEKTKFPAIIDEDVNLPLVQTSSNISNNSSSIPTIVIGNKQENSTKL